MATTMYLWFRSTAVTDKYKTPLIISGLVTFIAAYHYIRIFNSWVDAYHYPSYPEMDNWLHHHVIGEHQTTDDGITPVTGLHGPPPDYHIHHKVIYGVTGPPVLTGVPFNDAYRYMDWLLTVPLLLMEIVLVMKLPEGEASKKCWTLGVSSAVMIIVGYPGELIVEGPLATRWICWACALVPFCYIVYELLVGLAGATSSEPNDQVKSLIFRSQWVTVVSWLTYPVVYIFPMLGLKGAGAVVAIQCGYCASDIISKCGVGLIIYSITAAKSEIEAKEALLP